MTRKEIQAHWEYVKGVLEIEIPEDMSYSKIEHIQSIGFHYQTAMAHGAKHEEEDNNG